jgi:hypothetical protein
MDPGSSARPGAGTERIIGAGWLSLGVEFRLGELFDWLLMMQRSLGNAK